MRPYSEAVKADVGEADEPAAPPIAMYAKYLFYRLAFA